LIDEVGHLIHIDYGFILGPSPGRNLGFEMAPFKLSKEMVELMGGVSSEIYHKYCNLAVQCFLAAREVMLPILSTVVAYADSDLPCFQYKESVLKNLKNRFVPQMTDIDAANQMKNLIEYARQHWTTAAYDGVQKLQNNIFSEEWR
jgi:phosphatidylinositol 4-kinase